jgi:hypothetical protein
MAQREMNDIRSIGKEFCPIIIKSDSKNQSIRASNNHVYNNLVEEPVYWDKKET